MPLCKLHGRHASAKAPQHGAQGMIARHGADAAREATIYLNRLIDRGDLAARDLWACIVHRIRERQNGNNGTEMAAD
ncbi:MAG: hypothetical protein WB697_15310 [Stellaceae bacterium]